MSEISKGLIELLDPSKSNEDKPSLLPYIYSLNTLLKMTIEERRFLLNEFCPLNSIGMVFAQRGIGKSWFCMQLALAISEGHEHVFGWKIHEAGPVLYIDGEMTLSDIRTRFSKLSDKSLTNENLMILPSETLFKDSTPIKIDEASERKRILRLLQDLESSGRRPKLIILDNLSTLRGPGSDENSNSDEEPLMNFLNELRHMGYAVLVVHHAGKSGAQRGASKKEDIMDYVIKLERTAHGASNGAEFKLSFSKMRHRLPSPEEFECKLIEDKLGQLHMTTSIANDAEGKRKRILKAIAELSKYGSITQKEIADKCDIPKQTISSHIKLLKCDDLLLPAKELTISKWGLLILHETWPNQFDCPEGLKPGMRYQSPF